MVSEEVPINQIKLVLKHCGGSINNLRPGEESANYLKKIALKTLLKIYLFSTGIVLVEKRLQGFTKAVLFSYNLLESYRHFWFSFFLIEELIFDFGPKLTLKEKE